MRGLIVFSLAALLILGFFAYRSPRVRELFEPSQPPRPAMERTPAAPVSPPAAREAKPAAKPEPAQVPRRASENRAAPVSSPPPPPQPPPKPSVSNAEVSSVLMGIFRARQIYGVALSVSDTEIEVAGEVASEQQRRQVLDTIEKAREYRRVIATDLKVRQP